MNREEAIEKLSIFSYQKTPSCADCVDFLKKNSDFSYDHIVSFYCEIIKHAPINLLSIYEFLVAMKELDSKIKIDAGHFNLIKRLGLHGVKAIHVDWSLLNQLC